MPVSLATRVKNRLRDMGREVPPDAVLQRTHAGRHQRADGALSWTLWSPSRGDLRLGSHHPASTLVLCRGWQVTEGNARNGGDTVLDPCDATTFCGQPACRGRS